jgi:hypothetical protein
MVEWSGGAGSGQQGLFLQNQNKTKKKIKSELLDSLHIFK